jgi:hypothetical protein
MDKALAFTTEEGSRQLVYAAVGGDDKTMRGEYVTSSRVAPVSDYVMSEEGAEAGNRIWVSPFQQINAIVQLKCIPHVG